MPGFQPVRPVLSEAGDRAVYQLLVEFFECVVVNTEALGDPGTVLLYNHICILGQLVEDLSRFRFLEVERDALLIAVDL